VFCLLYAVQPDLLCLLSLAVQDAIGKKLKVDIDSLCSSIPEKIRQLVDPDHDGYNDHSNNRIDEV
jgi:hypothetical protein